MSFPHQLLFFVFVLLTLLLRLPLPQSSPPTTPSPLPLSRQIEGSLTRSSLLWGYLESTYPLTGCLALSHWGSRTSQSSPNCSFRVTISPGRSRASSTRTTLSLPSTSTIMPSMSRSRHILEVLLVVIHWEPCPLRQPLASLHLIPAQVQEEAIHDSDYRNHRRKRPHTLPRNPTLLSREMEVVLRETAEDHRDDDGDDRWGIFDLVHEGRHLVDEGRHDIKIGEGG